MATSEIDPSEFLRKMQEVGSTVRNCAGELRDLADAARMFGMQPVVERLDFVASLLREQSDKLGDATGDMVAWMVNEAEESSSGTLRLALAVALTPRE